MRKVIIFCLLIVQVMQSQKQQPNILWIVCEDISPTLSMYGDNTAKTPNLDALASQSIVYQNAFATVGVCAPSRSSIITGMQATSIGTMHMRTGFDIQSWGKRVYKKEIPVTDIDKNSIIQYSAVIPKQVKCFTEYLRAEGYFCSNNQKTDYQFAAPVSAWDQNNGKAHWKNRDKDQPFFSVFNIDLTHESKLWKHQKYPLTVDVNKVKVPPYFPDTKVVRKTIARHYSNIEMMDKKVGDIIKQLKQDGLYDDTIIFFYSDHGGPLPRQKREILDSGLKVPLMVKLPNANQQIKDERLISFVDLAPTILSLANIKTPKYMDGQPFLGKYDTSQRNYVFGSSDRFDEFTDRIRSVRNKRYLYLKNYHTNLTKYKDVAYRKQVPLMVDLLLQKEKGNLNNIQRIWFDTKQTEELYDCVNDPFNLVNLVNNKKHVIVLKKLRKALDTRQKQQKDYGSIPEAKLIEQMWPNLEQPITKPVEFKNKKGCILLSTKTKGASISYIISDKKISKIDNNSGWQLYTKPIKLEKGKILYTIAERIGYKQSSVKEINR